MLNGLFFILNLNSRLHKNVGILANFNWIKNLAFVGIVGVCCLSTPAHAAFELPRNLTIADQKDMFEVLGFGTGYKYVANTYPLGGYSGIEIGLGLEMISTDTLRGLGSGTNQSDDIHLYTLNFNKGLYHNVDVGFSLTPSLQASNIRTYGGFLRWGFYEVKNFPMIFSVSLYGGGANYDNLLSVTTFGGDLIATVMIDDIAIYTGYGRARANGTFIGGADGITVDQKNGSQDMHSSHILFGMTVSFDKFFVALQADKYFESVYSARIGFRF